MGGAMSLVDQYAAERKARLKRLGAIPTNRTVSKLVEANLLPKKQPEIIVPPVTYFYPGFWMWELISLPATMPITIANIQSVTASVFNIPAIEIRSQRRTSDVVLPRHVAMYLCKEMTEHSLPKIGRLFGGKDHTTVLHAVTKIAGMIETDADLARKVEGIKARFA